VTHQFVALLLLCMFDEVKPLQAQLEQDDRQLAGLRDQLQCLQASLEKGAGLVSKWGEPISSWRSVLRFFTSRLDKKDIKDVSMLGVAIRDSFVSKHPGKGKLCLHKRTVSGVMQCSESLSPGVRLY
jgi:hypothetical protein